MDVSIVKEWFFPKNYKEIAQTDKNNPMFYVVTLQWHKIRFLKIGTAENGVKTRFAGADYKKYSTIKFLYVAELKADKKNKKNVCYHVEDLTRSAIREMKGFTFVKNDRFRYFQLPEAIPVYTGMNNYKLIPCKNTESAFFNWSRTYVPDQNFKKSRGFKKIYYKMRFWVNRSVFPE